MSRPPQLALLIPAYNAAGYLPRLLESAARQTEPFDEIWVYDDCSTDETSTVAMRLGARVVRGDVNSGCSHGKNVLAARTNCEWVHFHDADDELLPNFVELARRRMVDGRSDVVLFAYEERDDASGRHLAFKRFDPDLVRADPRRYTILNQVNPFCGLYRRDGLLRAGGHDEDPLVLYNEDVAFHIRLAFAGLTFAAETEISIVNHRRAESMSSSNRLKCLQAQYHVMRKTAGRDGSRPYARDISRMLWMIVGGLAAELDWTTADLAAKLAVELDGLAAVPSGIVFRSLCRFSPYVAVRVREWLIRCLRPRLRDGYPGWRAPFAII
jgi:glycosyltransferase involved in cell wall biosynthesis